MYPGYPEKALNYKWKQKNIPQICLPVLKSRIFEEVCERINSHKLKAALTVREKTGTGVKLLSSNYWREVTFML